jgi:hypothetical protein
LVVAVLAKSPGLLFGSNLEAAADKMNPGKRAIEGYREMLSAGLDISDMPKGIYFIRLEAEGEVLTRKLTVE